MSSPPSAPGQTTPGPGRSREAEKDVVQGLGYTAMAAEVMQLDNAQPWSHVGIPRAHPHSTQRHDLWST